MDSKDIRPLNNSNASSVTRSPRSKRKNYTKRKHEQAKDELEYATNWRRAFHQIFTHLKWLNAYAKINYIAAFK